MAKPSASHALEWAERGQNSSSVLVTAQRLLALQNVIRKQLPLAMQPGFAVAQAQGNEITVIADHAALAAKLRQLQPTLLKHIQAAGWNTETIRIKVASRPNSPPSSPTSRQARVLDETDLNHFDSLSQQLDAGPLADAVKRLLTHHRTGARKS